MRLVLSTLVAVLLTQPALAFVAQNGLVVEPRGESRFEIPYRGLSGDSDFWCAAGDYVLRELSLAPSTRIYRLNSPPRRAGQGITFSLSSEGAKRPGFFILSRDKGLSASFARSFCDAKGLISR
jgi:hypothetical protein